MLIFAAVVLSSCEPGRTSGYVPGLGEIMSLTQMRHIKLGLAGEAGNWPLAAYELDELKEGFADVATFHPTHDHTPIVPLLEQLTGAPLQQVSDAISARDGARFNAAYDALTRACNACHTAAHFSFNVVTRPTSNPYTNQRFEPSPDTAG